MKFMLILTVLCFAAICSAQNNSTSTPITSSSTTTTTTTTTSTSTTTTTTQTSSTTKESQVDCQLSKSSLLEKEMLESIRPMKGEKYEWHDDEHQYFFSVCSTAENAVEPEVGLLQRNMNTNKTFVIGRLKDVDLEGARNVLRVVYKNGDKYANACNKAERTAVIYFVCNPENNDSKFRMIEENTERDEKSCDYIFELYTPKVCVNNNNNNSLSSSTSKATTKSSESNGKKSGLSPFSIFLIVVLSLFVVYLTFGTVYLRVVKKARGWEQIPNWTLWNAIGNRSADCCNYICRCGHRASEVHTYENITDHVSDDENLLNM